MTKGRPRNPIKNVLSDNDKKKLWRKYVYLVIGLAKRYIYRCQLLQIEDLIQEGWFGLARAYELFDEEKGMKFSTYATMWIKQFIKRVITEKDVDPRIPINVLEDKKSYRHTIEKLGTEMSRKPTIKEIAQEMDVSLNVVKIVKRLVEAPPKKLSIDSLKDRKNFCRELIIGKEKEKPWTPELESKDELNHFLEKHLNQQEARVIKLKFLQEYSDFSDKKIGKILRVSGGRVGQVRRKALEKLRQALKV